MNLDDLTLLRGWIRQVEWPELDTQLADDGARARARVRALRQNLAVKSRYYGKPAWEALWLGERQATPAWERSALHALRELEGLPDPAPSLEHLAALWFPDALCAALPSNSKTLGDVVDVLEAHFAGDYALPAPLHPFLKPLIAFFDGHHVQLGYQLNKKPKPTAPPVALAQVAPLERVLIPVELDGAHGSNRSPGPCRIHASHDLDAIKSWLALKDDNAKTYQAYKKELERLLLWAVLERGKAVSSLNTDDCRAYIQFLKNLTTANSQWVALEPANKSYGKWKPFYCRPGKSKDKNPVGTSTAPQKVLSPKSINYAKIVISSCMGWLVKQHYLKHNNFDDIQAIKFAQDGMQVNNRAFTLGQIKKIFAHAESLIESNPADFLVHRRSLFILKFAFSTGLRIHELAAASYGDIECLEDDEPGEQYFLKVTGKQQKIRKTSLPAVFMEELKQYLRQRGLPTHLDFLPKQAPLIPSLRDKTGRKHLTPAGIHKILASFFKGMLAAITANPAADPSMAAKLRLASAHWLRHSYGSYLANDKQVPLTYIRDELGHASINTTSLYLNTDAKQRQKIISDAFSEP
jgi:integrase